MMNKIKQLLSVFRELWETWKNPVIVETVLGITYRLSYQHPDDEFYKDDYLCRHCNILKATRTGRIQYRLPVRFCAVFPFLNSFAIIFTEVSEAETLVCQLDAESPKLPIVTSELDSRDYTLLVNWLRTYPEKKKRIEDEKVRKYEEWRRMWAY